MLSHFLFSATLVLGEEGTSAPDRALARSLRELCARYKIAAIFGDKRRKESGNVGYSHLYRIADACVSTSVLEGFGYALYEPWLYGKAVVGRLPCGTAPSEIPGGAGLYRQLLVPKEWIDIAELKRLYLRQMKLCFGNHLSTGNAGAFSRAFDREFVRGKGIDFGCLDIATQCAVFEAVCRSGKRRRGLEKSVPRPDTLSRRIVGEGIASVNHRCRREPEADRGRPRHGRVCFVVRGMFRKAKGCAGNRAARLPQDPKAFLQPRAVPPARDAAGARRNATAAQFPLDFFRHSFDI